MSRSQARQQAATEAKNRAEAHRKETQDGVENARRGPFGRVDHEFIHGWTQQRKGDQDYLDEQARETAKAAKRRWF